jgi:hypothetical protein
MELPFPFAQPTLMGVDEAALKKVLCQISVVIPFYSYSSLTALSVV